MVAKPLHSRALLDPQKLATNLGSDKHESQTRQRYHCVLTRCGLHVHAEQLNMGREDNEEAEPKEARVKVHLIIKTIKVPPMTIGIRL